MASNILRELISLIGMPAALNITRVYGGRMLRVPLRVSAVHPLTVLIGSAAAAALCREYGGIELDVPSERTALIEQRNTIICTQYIDGVSIHALSRRHMLSRPMVRKVLRERRLFDTGSPGPSP